MTGADSPFDRTGVSGRLLAEAQMRVLIRRFIVAVIGLCIILPTYFAVTITMQYRRDSRFAAKLRDVPNSFAINYVGPDWLPTSLRSRLPVFDRVTSVTLRQPSVSLEVDPVV